MILICELTCRFTIIIKFISFFKTRGNYRKAFFACRKHRIDLNVIVDHDPERLKQNISSFIDQIPEVDHLNLFLTLTG